MFLSSQKIEQLQRVPTLLAFWDLEKTVLHEISVTGTLLWSRVSDFRVSWGRTLKIFSKLVISHHNFVLSVNLFYGTFIVSSSYPKKFSQLLAPFLLTREKLFLLTKKPYGDSFID